MIGWACPFGTLFLSSEVVAEIWCGETPHLRGWGDRDSSDDRSFASVEVSESDDVSVASDEELSKKKVE